MPEMLTAGEAGPVPLQETERIWQREKHEKNALGGVAGVTVLCSVYTCRFDNQVPNEKLVKMHFLVVKVA